MRVVFVLQSLHFALVHRRRRFRRRRIRIGVHVGDHLRPGDHAAVDAADERVGAEAVGAVVLVVDLTDGKQSRDVGHLVVIDPQPAHRVVHGREDQHRRLARIFAGELFVDLDDAFHAMRDLVGPAPLRHLAIGIDDVEVDLVLAADAEPVVAHRLEDLARGDVARHQVLVLRVFLLEEVPALALGDGQRIARRRPSSSAPRRARPRRAATRRSGAACRVRRWPSGAPE